MSGFFVFEAGACLWLAIVGVLLAGIAIEPRADGPEISSDDLKVVFIVLSVFCVGLVLIRAVIAWGTTALAAIIVLGCGLVATFINAALNRAGGRDWIKIPTPIVGVTISLSAVIFVCALVFPTIWKLEYEEYSYGTETRGLEYVHRGGEIYLVEQTNSNNYIFRYERRDGDAFGNHRYILDAEHVVWLEEETIEPYVEGEVTAMVKIDPISDRPIEIQNGKTFQPATLYVSPSDVWTTDDNDHVD